MYRVFLGIGSNLGDREKTISEALLLLGLKVGQIIQTSSIIETAAWGKKNSPNYLNAVLEINSKLLPLGLIKTVLEIEKSLGRERIEKWASRTIDIDILYFENWHFNTPSLIIPHPYIHLRKFVLEPLVEISPEFIHPIFQKSNTELCEISFEKESVKP
jgi:2-amino-4-hydroxy-6-hydroxymethyldihydropteridine diphosphokinase